MIDGLRAGGRPRRRHRPRAARPGRPRHRPAARRPQPRLARRRRRRRAVRAPGAGAFPPRVANEANLAARAEAHARRGSPSFAYVSGEVGIGGAIVLDGEIFPGRHGWSGEIGHIVVDAFRGPRASDGSLEALAGQDAMLRAAGLAADRPARRAARRARRGRPPRDRRRRAGRPGARRRARVAWPTSSTSARWCSAARSASCSTTCTTRSSARLDELVIFAPWSPLTVSPGPRRPVPGDDRRRAGGPGPGARRPGGVAPHPVLIRNVRTRDAAADVGSALRGRPRSAGVAEHELRLGVAAHRRVRRRPVSTIAMMSSSRICSGSTGRGSRVGHGHHLARIRTSCSDCRPATSEHLVASRTPRFARTSRRLRAT